jgi:pilus assembly protein CpaE
MSQKLKVVVAGRSARALKPLVDALAGASELVCSTYLIGDGHAGMLFSIEPTPDVLVLRLDADSMPELATLAGASPDGRPPMIVVGPAGNAEAVRLAVRSGARDFLADPVKPDDLVAAVLAVRSETAHTKGGQRAEIVVVLGAAGGVGTSVVACNLALAITKATKAPTLLLDHDVNAAPLASFLDLAPERGLPAALAEVEYLDDQALAGYVAKHSSGLRLMGAPAASLVPPRDIDLERLATLLGVLSSNFRYIVVDGSHALDDVTVTALGMARTVVLVVQQSVAQLKKAARTLGTLCTEIGIPADRILVVVNRYAKHVTVGLDDIRRALGHPHVTVLPSHYKSVLASIDSGMPLLEYDESSPVSKALVELQQEIVSGQHVEHHGLLHRALPIFSGG